MFFVGDNARFLVTGVCEKKRARGEHKIALDGTHIVCLDRAKIAESYSKDQPMGGNRRARSPKMAAAMVFVHELQHANQSISHDASENFFQSGRRGWGCNSWRSYVRRPCERDARAFVDDHYDAIAEFAGVSVLSSDDRRPTDKGEHRDELRSVAESFEGARDVTVRDIAAELRASGMNNAKNVERVVLLLAERGVSVR